MSHECSAEIHVRIGTGGDFQGGRLMALSSPARASRCCVDRATLSLDTGDMSFILG